MVEMVIPEQDVPFQLENVPDAAERDIETVPPPEGGAFTGAPLEFSISTVIGPRFGDDEAVPVNGDVVTTSLLGRLIVSFF